MSAANRTVAERTRSKKFAEFLNKRKKRSPKIKITEGVRVIDEGDGIEMLVPEPIVVDLKLEEETDVNGERIEAGGDSSVEGDEKLKEVVLVNLDDDEEGNEVSKMPSECKIEDKKNEKNESEWLVEEKRIDIGGGSKGNEGDMKKKNNGTEAKSPMKKPKINTSHGKKGHVQKKNKDGEVKKQKVNVSRQSVVKKGDTEKKNKELETKQKPKRQPPAKGRKIIVRRPSVTEVESESSGDVGERNDHNNRPRAEREFKKSKKRAMEADVGQRNVKRRTDGKKEGKKQKKKEVESKKQRNDVRRQRSGGNKGDRKQKKKVAEEEKEEFEDEEDSEKSETALSKFPMNRIYRIIKSEDFKNRIAQEAVFVINKASEKFLELISKEAYVCAFLDQKIHVAYNHLSSVVSKTKRFDFLSGIDQVNKEGIPQRREEEKQKEQEELEASNGQKPRRADDCEASSAAAESDMLGTVPSEFGKRRRADDCETSSAAPESDKHGTIPYDFGPAPDEEEQEAPTPPAPTTMDTLLDMWRMSLTESILTSKIINSQNDRLEELEREVTRLRQANYRSSMYQEMAIEALKRAETAEKLVENLQQAQAAPSKN